MKVETRTVTRTNSYEERTLVLDEQESEVFRELARAGMPFLKPEDPVELMSVNLQINTTRGTVHFSADLVTKFVVSKRGA